MITLIFINTKILGRDEKGCLLSTTKKAVVDVDGQRRLLEKCSLHFHLVDVDGRRWLTVNILKIHFSYLIEVDLFLVDVDHPALFYLVNS